MHSFYKHNTEAVHSQSNCCKAPTEKKKRQLEIPWLSASPHITYLTKAQCFQCCRKLPVGTSLLTVYVPPKINLKPSLIEMMLRGPGSSTPTKSSGHRWSPGAKSITQEVPCLILDTSNVLATVRILSLNVVLHVTHYSSLVSPSRCLVRQQ